MGLDDRPAQAPGAGEVGAADQGRGDREGDGQGPGQGRERQRQDAMADQHDQGHGGQQARARGHADLVDLDAEGLQDARVVGAGHRGPAGRGQLAHQAQAHVLDEFQLQGLRHAVAAAQHRPPQQHEPGEGEEHDRKPPLGPDAPEQALGHPRHAPGRPAAARSDHQAEDRHEEQQPQAVEHRPERDQPRRPGRPPAGEGEEGARQGAGLGAEARRGRGASGARSHRP